MIVSSLWPSNPVIVEEVLQRLARENWTSTYSWPLSVSESIYYASFSSLLDTTFVTVVEALRYHEPVYARQTTDGIADSSPLEPKIVGCEGLFPTDQDVSWSNHVGVPAEVGISWPDVVAQASTYTGPSSVGVEIATSPKSEPTLVQSSGQQGGR